MLFGGLGYVQASRELAISPSDMAALLRAVLHRAAIRGDAESCRPGGLTTPHGSRDDEGSPHCR